MRRDSSSIVTRYTRSNTARVASSLLNEFCKQELFQHLATVGPLTIPHLHVFAEEEEDGDGVAEDAAAADDELQDPLQQEAQQLQQHKLLLRGLGERGHQRSQ